MLTLLTVDRDISDYFSSEKINDDTFLFWLESGILQKRWMSEMNGTIFFCDDISRTLQKTVTLVTVVS